MEALRLCPYCNNWGPASAARCPACGRPPDTQAPPSAAFGVQAGASPMTRDQRSEPLLRDDELDLERPRRPRRDEWDDDGPRRREHGPYADCPYCGCPGFAERVSFTWWGGIVGPAMLNHVRCSKCRTCYNGTTGRDNMVGITIYTVVALVLGLGLVVLMVLLAR